MDLSMRWLKDYVDIGEVSMRDFSEAMSMSGSKVEGWKTEFDEVKNVVVGKILSVEKHPDSDHLVICQLDVGQEEPVQIVTGRLQRPCGRHRAGGPAQIRAAKWRQDHQGQAQRRDVQRHALLAG